MIIDIFSRYVVGWLLAERESAALAKRLIEETIEKQGVSEDELTLHSDRGPSMKSHTVAQLLANLGVTKSHSRPYTSNDNPFSESHFKTFKYRPGFPKRFGCLEDARTTCRGFFSWYNDEHRHSGIGLLTPCVVHNGLAEQVHDRRQQVLTEAYSVHPERFVRKPPQPPAVPQAVWINPPSPPLELGASTAAVAASTPAAEPGADSTATSDPTSPTLVAAAAAAATPAASAIAARTSRESTPRPQEFLSEKDTARAARPSPSSSPDRSPLAASDPSGNPTTLPVTPAPELSPQNRPHPTTRSAFWDQSDSFRGTARLHTTVVCEPGSAVAPPEPHPPEVRVHGGQLSDLTVAVLQ